MRGEERKGTRGGKQGEGREKASREEGKGEKEKRPVVVPFCLLSTKVALIVCVFTAREDYEHPKANLVKD